MGFDEVRVRYRKQRREIIREVIIRQLTGKAMKQYISLQAKKQVQTVDYKAFIEDLFEDLEQMDESRLAGLGVSIEQLKAWDLKNKKKSKRGL